MNSKKKAKKTHTKNQWQDHLTKLAKTKNYPARSIYKLEEIQNKFKIIKRTDLVLDLGCAPGSWLLYTSKLTKSHGKVYGIDLKEINIVLPDNAIAIKEDIYNFVKSDFLKINKNFDVILSDMAPSTTGRKDIDTFKSFELCKTALIIVENCLNQNGNFVCKIFQGNDFNTLVKNVKLIFKETKIFKPQSTRKQSREIYIVAKNKK